MATMLKLKSSDNEIFEIEKQVIIQSQTIKNMIEDLESLTGEIPLQISSQALAKVLEWCKKEHEDEAIPAKNNSNNASTITSNYNHNKRKKEVPEWKMKFLAEMSADIYILHDLIMAANFLDIPALLDDLCQQVANMIKGKMPEQIRQIFKIKNDFSPEEERKITDENVWAFDQEQ